MNPYERDHEDTLAALQKAIQKREQIDVEIEALNRRLQALETLIETGPMSAKISGKTTVTGTLTAAATPAQDFVIRLRPQVTERVRGLLYAASGALTSGDIYEELKRLGTPLQEKSNPWALIHGICRRLVEQGFAREVEKDGRKAWATAKA
jgi:hypothetical protein